MYGEEPYAEFVRELNLRIEAYTLHLAQRTGLHRNKAKSKNEDVESTDAGMDTNSAVDEAKKEEDGEEWGFAKIEK